MTPASRPSTPRAADTRGGGLRGVKVVSVVRHAHALDRSSWEYPDEERPLSAKGRRQALEVAARLSGSAPAVLFSSPATRCRQTLEPLASLLGLECVDLEELAEGRSPTRALESLLVAAGALPGDLVACTHGDVLDGLLEVLSGAGVDIDGPRHAEKAATFELLVADGSVGTVRYIRAPSAASR